MVFTVFAVFKMREHDRNSEQTTMAITIRP